MAVESEADRAVFVDPAAFAVAAVHHSASAGAVTINGLFDHGYAVTAEAFEVGVQNRESSFTCRASDLVAADGDFLDIADVRYVIREIQPDGEGMTRLVLEKQ